MWTRYWTTRSHKMLGIPRLTWQNSHRCVSTFKTLVRISSYIYLSTSPDSAVVSKSTLHHAIAATPPRTHARSVGPWHTAVTGHRHQHRMSTKVRELFNHARVINSYVVPGMTTQAVPLLAIFVRGHRILTDIFLVYPSNFSPMPQPLPSTPTANHYSSSYTGRFTVWTLNT